MLLMKTSLEFLARILPPHEGEAMLGDLYEAKAGFAESAAELLGLAARRQLACWANWRPWVALVLAATASFLLMGASYSVSRLGQRHWGSGLLTNAALLLRASLLIIAAFISGSVTRRLAGRTTLAISLVPLLACTYCLLRFQDATLTRWCLLAWLPAAAMGFLFGQRMLHFRWRWLVPLTMTGLTLLSPLPFLQVAALVLLTWLITMPDSHTMEKNPL
jgi:hypothetical protein